MRAKTSCLFQQPTSILVLCLLAVSSLRIPWEDRLFALQRLPKVLTSMGDASLGPSMNVVRVQHLCEPQ